MLRPFKGVLVNVDNISKTVACDIITCVGTLYEGEYSAPILDVLKNLLGNLLWKYRHRMRVNLQLM